jgi:SSS family solute:Na+ symporter
MTLFSSRVGFGAWNYVVLVLYLAIMMGIGIYFNIRARLAKKNNTDEYFRSGNRIPGWIAGFSIYATTISAITYMSTPAKAFTGDWLWAFGNLTIFLVTPIIIRFIIPFFKKLNATTGYEYLEKRFGYFTRAFASVMFILFHVVRIGIVIYLPTIALTAVTDINPYVIATVIGVFCIVYTILGGMGAVIWTEFIQAIVLIGGIVIAIIFALVKIDGGLDHINSIAIDNDKILTLKDLIPSGWAQDFIIILFIGQFINTLYQYIGSQDVIQRYQSNKSLKQTKKGLWTNVILSLLTIFLFYGMGTLLFVYYKDHPAGTDGSLLPSDITSDQVLPYFIVSVLPAGVAGLIIAGIYAASMGTISSSLHCSATCIIEDIVQKVNPNIADKSKMLWARIIIGISGVIGTAISLVLIYTKSTDMLDLVTSFISMFGVSVTAIYLLGIFTKRTSNIGAILGGILGFVITLAFFFLNRYHIASQFYGTILAFIVSMLSGWLFSFAFKNKKIDQLDNLTIHSFSKEDYKKLEIEGEEEWAKIKQEAKDENIFKMLKERKAQKANKSASVPSEEKRE